MDRIPWDEACTKLKSLIYLSLRAEARGTYHQKNSHTQIEECTTYELVHELNITSANPQNSTFDRFNFFKSMHQPHETLETFYSGIREACALFKFKELEEDLAKDLFISNTTNTPTQMDLLSEVRTPPQVLILAINRERGKANQQEILKAHTNNTSWSQVSYIRKRQRPPAPQRTLQQPILPTPPTGEIAPCYKCGQSFIRNHLNMCKAQKSLARIAKRSLCKAPMPEGRNPSFRQKSETFHNNKILHKQDDYDMKVQQQNEKEEPEEETVDAEAALFIKKLMEDSSSVNTIRPTVFKEINDRSLNKETGGEVWVKTNYGNTETDWLADTVRQDHLCRNPQQMTLCSNIR